MQLRLLFVLAVFSVVFLNEARADQRPNIVFILADDLAWSDLGCFGNTVHNTPNLDQLAKDGLRFTNAYAPAPICSASRAALLTGKTPARLNFEFVTKSQPGEQNLETLLQSPPFTMNLPRNELTIGEVLQSAGYATGFYGKWHLNQHHQRYLGWSPTYGPHQQGFLEGDSDFGSHPYSYRQQPELRKQVVPNGEFPKDSLTRKAIEFLERHQKEPFFLYLSLYYVHDPIHSRCEWLIDNSKEKLPAKSQPVRASYAAMVETLDHEVGKVLGALKETGLHETTMVVLMSDNGGHPNYTTNAPLRGSKWNLYEGGIRVPLIVQWPKHVLASSISETPVHGCDLFPTFCEAAQVRPPQGERDGQSLIGVFQNPKSQLRRPSPLVWHFPYYHPETGYDAAPPKIGVGDFVTSQTRPHSAIRDGDWKLLHFYEEDRVELYHLNTDLGEQTDLKTRRPDVTARLQKRLMDSLEQSGARFPKPRSQSIKRIQPEANRD